MKKTGSEIEQDVFDIIGASILVDEINGNIYKEGLRPLGSKKEDALVLFMTGIDGQEQSGVVNVNVYIPDIDNNSGTLVKNTLRCREIERTCQNAINAIVSSEYDFTLGSIIKTYPENEINQHFVNVRLEFRRIII